MVAGGNLGTGRDLQDLQDLQELEDKMVQHSGKEVVRENIGPGTEGKASV